MSAFFEFWKAHPWQMTIVLFVVASFSMILGYVIASQFANFRIADMFADLDNPKNVNRRIARR